MLVYYVEIKIALRFKKTVRDSMIPSSHGITRREYSLEKAIKIRFNRKSPRNIAFNLHGVNESSASRFTFKNESYVNIYIYIYIHIYIYIYIYACTCVYIYIYIYTYIHIHVYTYVYTYIHTYTIHIPSYYKYTNYYIKKDTCGDTRLLDYCAAMSGLAIAIASHKYRFDIRIQYATELFAIIRIPRIVSLIFDLLLRLLYRIYRYLTNDRIFTRNYTR
jgi:hypothetical protein